MLIVGERINSTRRYIARAIEEKNAALIQKEATIQVEAGAEYVDVNAGSFAAREIEYLTWLVETVQQVIDKPLCIDSANSKALAAALKLHKGKAIVNSITGERERYQAILPVLKEYNCSVVALTIDDSGIPATAEDRVSVAGQIVDNLTADGIGLDAIYIDPVVLPISVDFTKGVVVLDAIERIKQAHPGVHTICGLSNISFGLPARQQLNQAFLVMALQRGLDAAIVDPCDKQLMRNVITASVLLGKDEYCMDYINAYRKGKLQTRE